MAIFVGRVNDVLARTARYWEALDRDLQAGDTDVAVGERGNLSVKRLRAQPREPDVDELAREIANQLPVIDLPDLLIEVDRWTRFTRHLTHAGGATPRRDDHARLLFAALIAQACNLGAGRMARASDLSAAQVGWTSEWYLRHDTLENATGAIVDHQSTIALARRMGTGEHSSSDGKRRPVSPDSQQARALPRYFGRDRGLTHYGFVSDQHTHFATRVIRSTVRDATHVLDGILDNRSQLPIRTHSTDTAGYSDIIFALFDLLGLQFAPRLAGLPDTRLWYVGTAHDNPAGGLLRHRVKLNLIDEQWDELLRLAGSLHDGTVTSPTHPSGAAFTASSTSTRASTPSRTPSSTATKAAPPTDAGPSKHPGRGARARVRSDRDLEHAPHERDRRRRTRGRTTARRCRPRARFAGDPRAHQPQRPPPHPPRPGRHGACWPATTGSQTYK